jgi:2-hydroxy-6-oxonona-2,4-dienedioate hydrolase
MKWGWYFATGLLLAAIFLVVWTISHYQTEIQAAREQVATGSQIVDTPCGPIEYAEAGSGPAALVLHGAGGGYDQGLLLGSWIFGDGYRLIAPSRFGYLNSSIPADSSLEAQADAYACLLDALGVDQVTVAGISAGGLSALHFGMRYPERTSALIMVSAVSYAENPSPADAQKVSVINRIVGSNPTYWLALHTMPSTVASLVGVPRAVQAQLTPEGEGQMHQLLDLMLPTSMRVAGLAVDQSRFCPQDFPIQQISAPTLVIHARDDTLVPYIYGEHSAEQIPSAEFMTIEEGGHFLLGHYAEIRGATTAFLNQHQAEASRVEVH